MVNVEKVVLAVGHSYHLTTDDANVAPGETLIVNGSALGARDSFVFNGSAETDGKLIIIGGGSNDILTGGGGKDIIHGGGGADTLTGGAKGDVFTFFSGSDSIGSINGGQGGSGFDTITDFDAKKDKFVLNLSVTGVEPAVNGGAVHQPLFDTDLGNALAGLGAHHAVLFTTAGGDYNGHTFLIIDANGTTGYQAGDIVVDITGAVHLANLTTSSFSFI